MSEKEIALTWGGIRENVAAISIIAGAAFYLVTNVVKGDENTRHTTYRIDELEKNHKQTNNRLDNLSNTMINNVDLIRRDVNRQTTQIEVLASKLDIFMGVDSEPPKVRRSRPGGPIPADQSE